MKKTLLVVGASVFLFGCSSTQADSEQEIRFKDITSDNQYSIKVVEDKETGCKYIKYTNAGGITPLLDKNGKPDCSK